MFDVVFALNGSADVVKALEIDQSLQSVLFGETINSFHAMLKYATNKVVRHADIQNAVGPVGQKIDIATCHEAIMKDVDGRDKPGHDEWMGFN